MVVVLPIILAFAAVLLLTNIALAAERAVVHNLVEGAVGVPAAVIVDDPQVLGLRVRCQRVLLIEAIVIKLAVLEIVRVRILAGLGFEGR